MGVGIGITVDSRQVKEARREVDFLNKGLKEMEDADLAPDKDGLQATSELIRKISEDIRRMKGLVVKGEQQGSLLKKEQFQEAATLSKRIGQNMAEYTKEITKARNELAKLLAEKVKLERLSTTDPTKWVDAQDRLELIKGQEKGLREHYQRLKRQDPKAQDLARRGSEYTETIGGYGEAPSGSQEDTGTIIAKSLKAAGGLWLMSKFLGASREGWSKFQKQVDLESGLAVRGFRFDRRISEWNYTPHEEASAAMGLLRSTGANDMGTLNRLERFSRLSNMDMGTATGFIGGYYNVTSADPQKQRQAIDALLYMGKQAKDGRSEQLLGLINQNLMIASRAQGGRELTSSQTSTIMAQTAALYNAPGTMGFTSNLYQTMQSALMPGGSPASEILKWDIAGGFQKGPLTSDRMIELQQRRNAGLNDPTNLRRAIAGARRYSKSRSGQIMYMQMVLDSFGEQGGVDKAAAIIDNADRLMSARLPGSAQVDEISRAEGYYRETQGYGVMNRSTAQEYSDIMVGEQTEGVKEPYDKFKTRMKLVYGGILKKSKYDPLIETKAQKYGIDPNWLKAIVNSESGFNRFAVSRKGAKGLGQFMPKTGRQYGLKTDADFYDPEKSIDASAHYLRDLKKMAGGDTLLATMSYNAGPDAILNKGIRPAETRDYTDRVMGYLRQATLQSTGKEWTEDGQGGGRSGKSFGERMVGLLEELVTLSRERNTRITSKEVTKPMPARPHAPVGR